MSNTLTDMDRKEAIEIVRNIYQTDTEKEALETLIPELRESEDERIRDFLYEFIKVCGWSEKQFPPREKCLAYLEKQKESKPAEWNDPDMRETRGSLISLCRDWECGKKTILLPISAVRARYFLEHLNEPKQEWSEEDEQTINMAIQTLEYENYLTLAKRLKSLRSRPKSSDNLPKWKKASAGTKLPSESVIRAEDQDPRFGSVAVYDCEYITVNDLEKLEHE